ncbi:hypothetical protein CRYUN_Cryun13aG0006300 [Craigia yunnanensis]
MTTTALYLGLYDPWNIALSYQDVFKRFQVWRLITNFFFLGPFSPFFAVRLIMIARYGVLLERGPFDKRTADYVWMLIFGALSLLVMAAIPFLWTPFMAGSLVFMIVYVWSREFPNAQISIYGVVTLKGLLSSYSYSHWTYPRSTYCLFKFEASSCSSGVISRILSTLGIASFGFDIWSSLMEDIIGMVAGHLYYFLTVLHPLAGGKYVFKTPLWVHKLVAYWGEGIQVNSPVQRDPSAGVAFRGRSYRLNGNRRQTSTPSEQEQEQQNQTNSSARQPNSGDGVVFRGKSYRLSGH